VFLSFSPYLLGENEKKKKIVYSTFPVPFFYAQTIDLSKSAKSAITL